MRSDWCSACISDVSGWKNWIQLPQDNTKLHNGEWYMVVGTVAATPDGKLFLIEFNFEADNGARRCWIRKSTILETDGVGFIYDYPKELQDIKYEQGAEYAI